MALIVKLATSFTASNLPTITETLGGYIASGLQNLYLFNELDVNNLHDENGKFTTSPSIIGTGSVTPASNGGVLITGTAGVFANHINVSEAFTFMTSITHGESHLVGADSNSGVLSTMEFSDRGFMFYDQQTPSTGEVGSPLKSFARKSLNQQQSAYDQVGLSPQSASANIKIGDTYVAFITHDGAGNFSMGFIANRQIYQTTKAWSVTEMIAGVSGTDPMLRIGIGSNHPTFNGAKFIYDGMAVYTKKLDDNQLLTNYDQFSKDALERGRVMS